MDLNTIPKSFWHSASFALIVFTLGFLFISYKYGDLTVKFKDLEMRSSNTLALEESLQAQEKLVEEREVEIAELKSLLDNRAEELEEVKQELASLQDTAESAQARAVVSRLRNISEDEQFERNYRNKRAALDSLEQRQQQQEQIYLQQKNAFQIQQRMPQQQQQQQLQQATGD